MAKRFKTIKKEEPRSGNRARGNATQSVIQRPNPHAGEMIIFGLLILLLMTGTYCRNRVWNSKLDLWTDCVEKSPHKDRPHNNLANVFLNQGKYQEAISHLNEALRIDPSLAEAHNNLGNVFSILGDYREAINQYNEVVRIHPNHAGVHYNLGNAYLSIGNRGLALKEYEILKTMNPDLADALYQKMKKIFSH